MGELRRQAEEAALLRLCWSSSLVPVASREGGVDRPAGPLGSFRHLTRPGCRVRACSGINSLVHCRVDQARRVRFASRPGRVRPCHAGNSFVHFPASGRLGSFRRATSTLRRGFVRADAQKSFVRISLSNAYPASTIARVRFVSWTWIGHQVDRIIHLG